MARVNLKVLEELEDRLKGQERVSLVIVDSKTNEVIKEIKTDDKEPTTRITIRI